MNMRRVLFTLRLIIGAMAAGILMFTAIAGYLVTNGQVATDPRQRAPLLALSMLFPTRDRAERLLARIMEEEWR